MSRPSRLAGHKGLSLLGDSSVLLWLGVQSSLAGMQDGTRVRKEGEGAAWRAALV